MDDEASSLRQAARRFESERPDSFGRLSGTNPHIT